MQGEDEHADATSQIASLREDIDVVRRYAESLEIRLSQADAIVGVALSDLELADGEISRLKTALKASHSGHPSTTYSSSNSNGGGGGGGGVSESELKEIKFDLFCSLMESFGKERDGYDARIDGLQRCLHDATKDLLHALQDNARLQQEVYSLARWEPSLLPSKARGDW